MPVILISTTRLFFDEWVKETMTSLRKENHMLREKIQSAEASLWNKSKAELVKLAGDWCGYDSQTAQGLTVAELRQHIKEQRDAVGNPVAKLPTGMGKMNKGQLQEECVGRGLPINNKNVAELMRLLRQWVHVANALGRNDITYLEMSNYLVHELNDGRGRGPLAMPQKSSGTTSGTIRPTTAPVMAMDTDDFEVAQTFAMTPRASPVKPTTAPTNRRTPKAKAKAGASIGRDTSEASCSASAAVEDGSLASLPLSQEQIALRPEVLAVRIQEAANGIVENQLSPEEFAEKLPAHWVTGMNEQSIRGFIGVCMTAANAARMDIPVDYQKLALKIA